MGRETGIAHARDPPGLFEKVIQGDIGRIHDSVYGNHVQ
jgi:hypothetical protein